MISVILAALLCRVALGFGGCLGDAQCDTEPLALVQVGHRRVAARKRVAAAAAVQAPPLAAGSLDFSELKASTLDCALRRATRVKGTANKQIVLTEADYGYRDLLLNWVADVELLGVHNYCVICLDKELTALMDSVGRPCTSGRMPSTLTREDIWRVRLEAAVPILDAGIDVLLADTDAVFVRNPYPLLGEGDIVMSRGVSLHPFALQYGASVCMGFVLFRGNARVTRFVRDELCGHFLASDGDDQAAICDALLARKPTFTERMDPFTSRSPTAGSAGDLSLVFLDTRFLRFCPSGALPNDTHIAHCWNEGITHQEGLRNHGLWHLKDDWEATAREGGFEALLASARGDQDEGLPRAQPVVP